ncbi:MAG: cell division topological specificity factor MinE [Pseudomonadota bacterium]
MSFLDYLLGTRKKSAQVAKDRLQIILARERVDRKGPDFLPELRQELLQVISKYVKIDLDQVKVNLEHDGDFEVLELNIVLPEPVQQARKTAS